MLDTASFFLGLGCGIGLGSMLVTIARIFI